MKNLLSYYHSLYTERSRFYERFFSDTNLFVNTIARSSKELGLSERKTFSTFMEERRNAFIASQIAQNAKTVIFPGEQANMFKSVTKDYTDSLDFNLPFSDIFLQFDGTIAVELPMLGELIPDRMTGMLIRQEYNSVENIEEARKYASSYNNVPSKFRDFFPQFVEESQPGIGNHIITIYEDENIGGMRWSSTSTQEFVSSQDIDKASSEHWLQVKKLAIACIGYINCENVYLHKEGEVSEKVNRKREAKGKSRLEPYYVCRIRGVNYDSVATGTGTAHSIRYDVRGHFRKLPTGKTTWVKAHQRGVANELYVPKTYKVDSNSKPAWEGWNIDG